ncbi:MAG TPA: enoyl-CoA hydratase/isomerase family protein [Stellaceae bacterium]|nr:enoyl-CoA hydratase/isomerase family protein [Stellaceae bacterium]
MYDFITLDEREGIATLTLNRPAVLNAWHGAMRAEVQHALERCNAAPEVRAIIMTGAGDRAFCAGQDLTETKEFKGGDDGAAWLDSWFTFYGAIRRLEKPLIAALNGLAAGSGFQAALLADIRIGHPEIAMGQPEIDAGIPSTTGPWLMNERLGLAKTIELTLTGRLMPAEECLACGLLNHLVPRQEVMAKAREVAALLAAKPPIAMRLNKQRFREMTEAGFRDAIEAGRRIQREAYESGEPQAWMESFFAKRTRRNAPGE